MSESKQYYVKQVWRQKGDEHFDRIPFKEENKAAELSQTTYPVLLLETKSNGGSGAIFAIGSVTEPVVNNEAMEFANQKGEFLYHVPFRYDFVLEDKKNGITREELQDLTGQTFAPQAKGGLYEIEASIYEQLATLLKERNNGAAAPADKVDAPKKAAAKKATAKADKAPKKSTASVSSSVLLDALKDAQEKLLERADMRLVVEGDQVSFYPALLLQADDLVAVQEQITQYVAKGGNESIDTAAAEAAASGATQTPRYAKVIGLVEQLVSEGKYNNVQIPTVQKAFYRESKLPHPYLAIELQGERGHHILGADGTLYTAEGRVLQHYLGL